MNAEPLIADLFTTKKGRHISQQYIYKNKISGEKLEVTLLQPTLSSDFIMEFDHVLRIIGEFGPYQKRLYILVNLAIIPAAFQMLMNVFIAREPQWSCSGLNSTHACPMEGQSCESIRYTSTYTSIVSEVR